jgi:hypothetical protein
MEALVRQGLPEQDDPGDTWGRQASRRVSPLEDRPQQSSCVVKNTFIEIVNDSQPDMCGESPSFIRRRQASEPPLVRREAEYDRYRNEVYERRLQAGQAELAATKRPPTPGAPASPSRLASQSMDLQSENMNKVMLALQPVCPSEGSLTSTHQPSSPGQSTRQFSGGDVRSTADEQDFEDFGYHQFWMQGCLAPPHMMHGGIALQPEVDDYTIVAYPCSPSERTPDAEGQGQPDPVLSGPTWGNNRERRRRTRTDPMHWDDGVVTVMVRQIPRRFTQLMFLKEVNCSGFEGLFDFLYLPYDLKKGINVGYGFLNFITPQHAQEFRKAFDGSFLDKQIRCRAKPVRVHPASVQGYEANYRHFVQTKTGQKQDPQFSPLFFPKESVPEEAVSSMPVPPVPWCGVPEQQFHPAVAADYFVTTPVGLTAAEAKEADEIEPRLLRADFSGPCATCAICGAPHRAEHNFCPCCGRRLSLGSELKEIETHIADFM